MSKLKNNTEEYADFRIREIVYDFYVAGVGDRDEIEGLQKQHSHLWKDD